MGSSWTPGPSGKGMGSVRFILTKPEPACYIIRVFVSVYVNALQSFMQASYALGMFPSPYNQIMWHYTWKSPL